jgi:hypothetical protein
MNKNVRHRNRPKKMNREGTTAHDPAAVARQLERGKK